jgi:flagellar basal body P-ring protein FlgI
MICNWAWKPIGVSGLGFLFLAVTGCSTPLFRGQSPENKQLTDIVADERSSGPYTVGDLAVPVGTVYQKVEAVALVTQLDGTGSDPPPSQLRDQLKKEMQTHNVRRPEEALASKDTAMVLVRGFIPPGARKGDTFDVEVLIAPRTDTTTLRGGWLLQTRMREIAILENDLHTGHVAALAQGPIVIDALFDKSGDEVLETRGRVLMGAIVQIDRPMGLSIRSEHTSVKTSAAIGAAINDRFHDFDHGSKKGLANPTRDTFLELKVHSRYAHDVSRYIQVVRNIIVGESPVERIARLAELERQLLEPTTSQMAALQLEAIGKEAVNVLRKGLTATDPEIRFYTAETLAYLDDADAVPELFEAARTERAFRWRAMSALAVLDQFSAQEALLELMNVSSAETRYGAFRALHSRNSRDPVVHGEILGDEFAVHVMNTTGEPMIHIARATRPEIVLFGQGQRLESPSFLFAGKQILIKRQNEQTVKVSRFSSGSNDDKHETCSTNLEDVLRAIVKLGGGYAEAIQCIEEAKSKGFLEARVEIDALPRPGRAYHRDESKNREVEDSEETDSHDSIPDIFVDRLKRDRGGSDKSPLSPDIDQTRQPEPVWLDRMTRWMVL